MSVLEKQRIKRFSSRSGKKTATCYAILSPQIIGFFVFTLYPMLWAASKAFFFYDGTPSKTRFVGLENFIRIFTVDATYWRTWLNTLIFTIGKLPFELPIAMILALCMHGKLKGSGFFRSIYYLPCVISVAIIGVMFSNLFDYFGFINAWIVKLGIADNPVEWFANYNTAIASLVFASTWATFGANVLYFMAALSNVPLEVYESAKLDGASAWTTFWKITLPLMAPVLQTVLLLSLNGTLHTSEFILVTTNGAPGGSTYTVMSYLVGKFVPGFAASDVNIGYGCAMALVTSAFMLLIALGYMKLSKKMAELQY